MDKPHSDKITQGTTDFSMLEDTRYEYSKPFTITGGTLTQTVPSPFGVDSEACITYYSSNDSAGVCVVQYDGGTISLQTVASPPAQFLGNIFRNSVPGASMSPFFYPVTDNVYISANMPTGNFVLTLQFRRRTIMYVPYEETYYGDTNG